MNAVVGRSLSEIRGWFDHRVQAAPVGLVVHEAAHATVALALGFDVTEMTIWNDRGTWRGECAWNDTLALRDERLLVLAAGAASVDFLHRSIASGDWWGASDDITAMQATAPGLTATEREAYRWRARALLENNRDTFDRLATTLLRCNGEMTEAQIMAVAKPGFLPGKGSDLRTWTTAQRHALADKIEAMARTKSLPVDLKRKLERYASLSTPTAPTYRLGDTRVETRELLPGIRYSDIAPMEVRR